MQKLYKRQCMIKLIMVSFSKLLNIQKKGKKKNVLASTTIGNRPF